MVKEILQSRSDLAFYIKLYPLKIHKDAYRKAKAIVCSNSLELLERAFERKEVQDPECETDVVDRTIALAKELGITGTPAIVLPDGRVLSGALTKEVLLQYIDSLEAPTEVKEESDPS